MKRLSLLLSLGLSLATPLFVVGTALAASGTLLLSPSSGTVVNGNNISVAIHENSGATQINGTQANLSFPAAYFSVLSITQGPSWGILAQNTYDNSAGTIKFGVANISPLSGDQLVATIVFHAKASSVTAAVNFTAGSAVTLADGSGVGLTLTYTNGSYTLAAPPAPPPSPTPTPTPTPSPSPHPSPSPSTKPSPSPSTKPSPSPSPTTPPTTPTALKISGVASKDVGTNTATITWTTSAAATSLVSYGPDTEYGLTTNNSAMVTSHKIVLQSDLLEPGVTYHYQVKSTDASGLSAISEDYTFTTIGASVTVTVTDQNGKPLKGAEVSLMYATTPSLGAKSITGKTDQNGQTTLSGLPGIKLLKVSASVKYGGKTTNFSDLELKPFDPKNPTQTMSFKIKASKKTPIAIFLVPLLLVGMLAGLLLNRGKWPPPKTPTSSGASGPGSAPDSNHGMAEMASIPVQSPDDTEPMIIHPTTPPPKE